VRANIAYVGQEPFLFRGSIRDNILCGKPDASENELFDAAKNAQAHDFIMSFPYMPIAFMLLKMA
jgi:ATP-binding cassette subfamily B protein